RLTHSCASFSTCEARSTSPRTTSQRCSRPIWPGHINWLSIWINKELDDATHARCRGCCPGCRVFARQEAGDAATDRAGHDADESGLCAERDPGGGARYVQAAQAAVGREADSAGAARVDRGGRARTVLLAVLL